MNRIAISGRCQFAIRSDGTNWYLLDESTRLAWREIPAWQLSAMLEDSSDVQWIQTQDDDEIHIALGTAIVQCQALDFVLFLFDPVLSHDTRYTAAVQLEELLSVDGVPSYLEDILLSKPFPTTTDINLPNDVCTKAMPRLVQLICDIQQLQSVVSKVRDAWEMIPFTDLLHKQSREELESRCLKYGFFSRVVRAFGSRNELTTLQVSMACDPRLSKDFQRLSHIMHAWILPLTKAPDANSRRQRTRLEKPSFKTYAEDQRWPSQKVGYPNAASSPRTAHGAFEAAQSQVRKIVESAKQRRDAQANDIRGELVKSQLGPENDGTFAIMSLCNIASQLRGIRDDFAMECLNLAVTMPQGGDSQAFLQLGTALADARNFEMAQQSLEIALRLCSPLEVRATITIKSKLAHILVQQRQYSAALSMYEMIGAKNETRILAVAKADVLRKMGEYSRAMALYVAVRDSRNEWTDAESQEAAHRALAGIAEIARRRGDPNRAIRIYRKLVYTTRNDIDEQSLIVYEYSLAKLLKLVGRFSESTELANEILIRSPGNPRVLSLLKTLDTVENLSSTLPSNIRLLGSLRAESVNEALKKINLEVDRQELQRQIEVSRRILSEELSSPFSETILRLQLEDFHSTPISLAKLNTLDRFSREMKAILELHAQIARGDSNGLVFPRFKRSPWVFRAVVAALKEGDLQLALHLEVYATLLAA